MPPEHWSSLGPALSASGIEALAVSNCREARQVLESHPPLKAVVTDVTLPDGNWCCLLSDVVRSGVDAEVFVCAPDCPNHLSQEVTQRGGRCVHLDALSLANLGATIRQALAKAHKHRN